MNVVPSPRTRSLLVGLVGGVLLLAAGCGDGPSSADDPAGAPMTAAEGTLAGDYLADPPPVVPWGDGGTSIRFSVADGNVVVVADCNTQRGSVEFTGGRMQVGAMLATRMGCPQEAAARDAWLAEFLNSEPRVSSEHDATVLTGTVKGVELELVLRPTSGSGAAAALEGHTWRLVQAVQDGKTTEVPDGVNASVLLTEGTLTVQTGCNTGTATAETGDGLLRLGPLGTTRRACRGPEDAVESAVLTVLSGEVPFRVEGRHLTLGMEGRTLEFTAD